MELTHSTRRFLKTTALMIGGTGMLFAFYQWMVSRKGQIVEEMEYVQIQGRELLKDLWNRCDMYRPVYRIRDDYPDGDMAMISRMIDTPKKCLADCQSLLRLNKPFIRGSAWDACDGLLKTHNHSVEVVIQEMYESEGINAFLHDSRSDIYESEALLVELLRE